MNQIKGLQMMAATIKEHLNYLNSQFRFSKGVSISIGIGDHIFREEDFINFFNENFYWEPAPENFIDYKLKRYSRYGDRNFLKGDPMSKHNEEPSSYKNCGIIYLMCPEVFFQLEFIQEFKNSGKSLFKEFIYTEGKIKGTYPFVQLSSDWESGIQNAALSFKESIAFVDFLIKKEIRA